MLGQLPEQFFADEQGRAKKLLHADPAQCPGEGTLDPKP